MAVIDLANYATYKTTFNEVIYSKLIARYPKLAKWTVEEFFEEGFYFEPNWYLSRVDILIKNKHHPNFSRSLRPVFKFSSTAADLLVGGHDFWLRWFGMERAKSGNSRGDKTALYGALVNAYTRLPWVVVENISNYTRIRLRSTRQVSNTFEGLWNFMSEDSYGKPAYANEHYDKLYTFRILAQFLAEKQRGDVSRNVYFANTANYVG